ncbi:MAG: hypothetical protein ACLP4R_11910, partial [Solirubrobacteraceae bacterium]
MARAPAGVCVVAGRSQGGGRRPDRSDRERRAVENLTNEALHVALENLSYRERRVLELRYGLGDQH